MPSVPRRRHGGEARGLPPLPTGRGGQGVRKQTGEDVGGENAGDRNLTPDT